MPAVSHTADGGQSYRASSVKLRHAMKKFQESPPDIPQVESLEMRMAVGSFKPVLIAVLGGKQFVFPVTRTWLKSIKRDFEFLDALHRNALEKIK